MENLQDTADGKSFGPDGKFPGQNGIYLGQNVKFPGQNGKYLGQGLGISRHNRKVSGQNGQIPGRHRALCLLSWTMQLRFVPSKAVSS